MSTEPAADFMRKHADLIHPEALVLLPPGWVVMVVEMLASISLRMDDGTSFRVRWIKEKLGRLVVIYECEGPSRDAIDAIIEHVEEVRSAETCQVCGAPGTRDLHRWPFKLKTTCREHEGMYGHEV